MYNCLDIFAAGFTIFEGFSKYIFVCVLGILYFLAAMFEMLMILTMKKSKTFNERHYTEKIIEVEQNLMEKRIENGDIDKSEELLETNDVQIFKCDDEISV